MKRKFLIFFLTAVFDFLILGVNFSFAAPPASTVNRISPGNNAVDIPVNSYFRWESIPSATKYILTIDELAEEQDNIDAATYCSGGTCSFGFLALTIGTIEEGSMGNPQTYYWKVRAANTDGEGPAQPNGWSFTTEITEELPPPPPPPDGESSPITSPIAATTLEELFDNIINFLFYLVMALVPIMIIWAALMIASAAGKAEQVNKGKTIILWSLLAVAIVLLAKGLPAIIKSILGG